MLEKIIVPTLGESVTEATVSKWLKTQGDSVSADEPVVELETDKDHSIRFFICFEVSYQTFLFWLSSKSQ